MKKSILALLSILLVFITLMNPIQAQAKNTTNIAHDAEQYLRYMGTNLQDRSAIRMDEPVDPSNRSEATLGWLKAEAIRSGIPEQQIEEQTFTRKSPSQNKNFNGTNLILTIPGKSNQKQIIVGGHRDGAGYVDNASGISLLLAQAKHLATHQPPYTVKIIFFDAEEVGLLGSNYYVGKMSFLEKQKTLFMINVDSIILGDYPNLYGGVTRSEDSTVIQSEVYDLAVQKAKEIGLKVWSTAELDGYFQKHGKGPELTPNTLYTNPWTAQNPPPGRQVTYASPSTGSWGDHAPFSEAGIHYLQFEATNWFADGNGAVDAYSGYYNTSNYKVGKNGQVINTPFDTMQTDEQYFPGRTTAYLSMYAELLNKILMEPDPSLKRTLPMLDFVYIGAGVSFILILVASMLVWMKRRRSKGI